MKLAESKKRKDKAAQDDIEAGRELQETVIRTLGTLDADRVYNNRPDFEADLLAAFEAEGVRIPAPLKKAILAALSERDDTADICRDSDGNPEPDSELRDYENVPLKEDIREYFDREVRPHVPDAWINETVRDESDGHVGRVGYEIPFNRHFYQYTPPRPLEEIEADIAGLEKDIVTMLREVVG